MNFVVGGCNLQWGNLLVDRALPVDNASAESAITRFGNDFASLSIVYQR